MSDDLTTPQDSDDEGMKSLRAALKKAKEKEAERDKQLGELLKRDRTRTIQDKFAEHKIDTGIAKFVPGDLEVDKLDEWLGENAKFFGIQLGQSQSEPDPTHDVERQAQSRLSAITPGALPVDDPDLKAVLDAPSATDLKALIESAQAGRR